MVSASQGMGDGARQRGPVTVTGVVATRSSGSLATPLLRSEEVILHPLQLWHLRIAIVICAGIPGEHETSVATGNRARCSELHGVRRRATERGVWRTGRVLLPVSSQQQQGAGESLLAGIEELVDQVLFDADAPPPAAGGRVPLTGISRNAHLSVKTPAGPREYASIRRLDEYGPMHRHVLTGGAERMNAGLVWGRLRGEAR